MKHTITLTVLGFVLIVYSLHAGALAIFPAWLGCNFVLLGVAHFRKAHGLFGKRLDGTLPLWSWIVFFPLHVFGTLVWHVSRLLSSESRFNRVSDQLVVGRRLLSSEHPGGFINYVDLTAEFQEPKALRETTGYFAFPFLDASAPSPESLRAAVSRLPLGATFVHCAQGHGRTGLFALAILLRSGTVCSIDEGLSLLANTRPAIRLNSAQMECIKMYASQTT